MALFTVQPGTFWLHDRASLMASATAFERDSRTVKQVTIPVHGANPQRRPQPAPGPGRCVQQRRACATGVQPRQRRPRHTVPCRYAAEVLSLRGAFSSAVTVPNGSTITRVIVASPP